MNIHEFLHRIKSRISPESKAEVVSFDENGRVEHFPWLRRFFLAIVIILVSLASFGVGRLTSEGKREPIQIRYENIDSVTPQVTSQVSAQPDNSQVTASSKGTKYYFSWCGNTISEKNKINFASAAAAEAAGYTLAATCKSR